MAQSGNSSEKPGAGPEGPAGGETYAAVDLGTNNCRLLVARPRAKGFQVVEAFSRIVRLGEGLEAKGRLSEAAMVRTTAALKICAEKIRRNRAKRVRAVATAACRAASNCAAFVSQVRQQTGLELEIISSQEEAELALAGCAPLLTRERPRAIVFDIGGGSTEVTWLALEDTEAALSEAAAESESPDPDAPPAGLRTTPNRRCTTRIPAFCADSVAASQATQTSGRNPAPGGLSSRTCSPPRSP